MNNKFKNPNADAIQEFENKLIDVLSLIQTNDQPKNKILIHYFCKGLRPSSMSKIIREEVFFNFSSAVQATIGRAIEYEMMSEKLSYFVPENQTAPSDVKPKIFKVYTDAKKKAYREAKSKNKINKPSENVKHEYTAEETKAYGEKKKR